MKYEKMVTFNQYHVLSRKRHKKTAVATLKICNLSNGAISNDLERPLTQIFKSMPLFDVEYLRNGTRWRHSYNGILIRTYTCPVSYSTV